MESQLSQHLPSVIPLLYICKVSNMLTVNKPYKNGKLCYLRKLTVVYLNIYSISLEPAGMLRCAALDK